MKKDSEAKRVKKIAKRLGGRQVKGSGNKQFGGDICVDIGRSQFLIEEKPSILLTKNGKDILNKIIREAIERSRIPALLMKDWILMPISAFEDLLTQINNEEY